MTAVFRLRRLDPRRPSSAARCPDILLDTLIPKRETNRRVGDVAGFEAMNSTCARRGVGRWAIGASSAEESSSRSTRA